MRLQEHDAKIAKAGRDLIKLKERNKVLPICQLPRDIIFRIIKISIGWDPHLEDESTLRAWGKVNLREYDRVAYYIGHHRRDPMRDKWAHILRTCSYLYAHRPEAQKELYCYINLSDGSDATKRRIKVTSASHCLVLDLDRISLSSDDYKLAGLFVRARAARIGPVDGGTETIDEAIQRGVFFTRIATT
jgi:hypothetical protein